MLTAKNNVEIWKMKTLPFIISQWCVHRHTHTPVHMQYFYSDQYIYIQTYIYIYSHIYESESHSIVSDCLPPHGLYSPWNSPVQNTSGQPFPSPGDLPDPGLPHCRWIFYQLSHEGSPYTYRIILNLLFQNQL